MEKSERTRAIPRKFDPKRSGKVCVGRENTWKAIGQRIGCTKVNFQRKSGGGRISTVKEFVNGASFPLFRKFLGGRTRKKNGVRSLRAEGGDELFLKACFKGFVVRKNIASGAVIKEGKASDGSPC